MIVAVDTRAAQAAMNNAGFCDAVCRAQDLKTAFLDGYWLQAEAPVPLYPNLVTTAPGKPEGREQLIRDLRDEAALPSWSVKDSFAELGLDRIGMKLLFEAEWFHREPWSEATTPAPATWRRIDSAAGLAEWEAAWGQGPADSPLGPVFKTALLSDPDIAFLAFRDGPGIVAGIIANRAAESIGISNGFAKSRAERQMQNGIRAAASVWPGLPVVGYTSGEALGQLVTLGFQRVGPLGVWSA